MSIMQTIFMFYYVRVFHVVFEIDAYWFGIAQALFMVWNSINDPLFGCIQVFYLPITDLLTQILLLLSIHITMSLRYIFISVRI